MSRAEFEAAATQTNTGTAGQWAAFNEQYTAEQAVCR
jgi:hypothetical protein